MSLLADFPLYYEFIDDADQQRYQDWQRRQACERRSVRRWLDRHMLLVLILITTGGRPR